MPKLVKPRLRPLGRRLEALQEILGRVADVPLEWDSGASGASQAAIRRSTGKYVCKDYDSLVTRWRKALRWTDGLDAALSVMLAASASTQLVGEQLWFKILGPPSCGKTTLAEGLSLAKEYVYSKDSIRGFYQGWRDESGKDLSIAALANGKTLMTKDGDTLLKAPNLQQILSEGRGLYDRVGRTHYRNAVMHDYEGHRMTWLLMGTSALREIDESELGCRFLDCVVMDKIDHAFEDDVARMVALQESRAMLHESNDEIEKQDLPEMVEARKYTADYLRYLRENIVDLMSEIDQDEDALGLCGSYGTFVAYMRARPSVMAPHAEATREFSGRLVRQHVRLANSLAVVLNRKSIDKEVLRRVRKVALDTGRGVVLDICRVLRKYPHGLEQRGIIINTRESMERTRKIMKFLARIDAVKGTSDKTGSAVKYRLSKRVYNLLRSTD